MTKKPKPYVPEQRSVLNSEEKRSGFTNDLGTAIMRLGDVLANHDMTLTSIDLGSWEDGQVMRMSLDAQHAHFVEQGIDNRTGEMVNQVTVAGVIIRWPTIRQALPGNKFRYI